MRLRGLLLALVTLASMHPARADAVVTNGGVTATLGPDRVSLCNADTCRTWFADRLETESLSPGTGFSEPDFALVFANTQITSAEMVLQSTDAEPVGATGVRIVWDLLAGPIQVRRSVTLHEDANVFETNTALTPLAPVTLSGYTLDELALPFRDVTIHSFRAGADWRFDDGWAPFSIGPYHDGDWRIEHTGPGNQIGQWMTLKSQHDTNVVSMVLERRDYASSRMSFDVHGAQVAAVEVDFARDIVYFGPIEENAHAENERGIAGRARTLVPLQTLELERSYTITARDEDHSAWEFYKYLTRHRLTPYPRAVTFNTNRVDSNEISTGAKDDVNFTRMTKLVDAAREMGVDTFILDDGWQAISGDWCPDSDDCPEPRRDRDPTKFAARFPDAEFTAVRDLLEGDPETETDDIALGLWMTPMEFHPASAAFRTNPQWACAPVGHGTAALSVVDPDSGSNDAGLGVWNPLALGVHPDSGEPMRLVDYIEDRVGHAIEVYGARYFKFDFLVWIDCLGVEPADMYAYHDAFVAMVDRLQAAYPDVTFQIDETNDYRMFPFESVARGPSWFQNGTPPSEQLLHNIWNLSPYVPAWSLGQHALANGGDRDAKGIDMLMAAALPSHITFWARLDEELDDAERAQVKRWVDFYRAHPGVAGYTMPLLDDPLAGDWTALQSWDLDAGDGYLLAFRQSGADETRAIPLRGLSDETGSFTATLLDPADGSSSVLGTFTAEDLREGLPVTIGAPHGYAIVKIARA